MEITDKELNYKISLNNINIYVFYLKLKLMYLECPEARNTLPKENRLCLLKYTTDKFKKYINIRHKILAGNKDIIIPYISLEELYS